MEMSGQKPLTCLVPGSEEIVGREIRLCHLGSVTLANAVLLEGGLSLDRFIVSLGGKRLDSNHSFVGEAFEPSFKHPTE